MSVSGSDWLVLVLPTLAVSVRVYVPAGVPLELPLPLLPPQEQRNTSSNDGSTYKYRRARRFALPVLPGSTTHPIKANAHNQGEVPKSLCRTAPIVRAVVVTPTLKSVTEVALIGTLRGTAHVTPVGKPVQLRDAGASIPAPPMETIYLTLPPATTVAEL